MVHRGNRVFAVLFAFALCLILSGQASAGWVYENISTIGDQGQYASIAMDSEDRPHVAWYDADNAALKYAVREFTGWTVPVTVDTGEKGKWASIAINPTTDYPAIAYYDDSLNAAKYAWYNGVSWSKEVVDDGGDSRGKYTSLAFDASGMPYMSFHYDDGSFNDNGLKIAWRTGVSSWSTYILADTYRITNERRGLWSAIAMTSTYYPRISYRDEDAFDIGQWFGWRNASGWDAEPTINDTGLGEYADIALDSGDNPFISSVRIDPIGDDCAALIYKFAGTWYWETVECGLGDDFGKWTGIAIDTQNRAHFSYHGDDTLNYSIRTGVDTYSNFILDSGGVTGQHTDIALDAQNNPYIVYYDAGAKDLKFVYNLAAPTIIAITPDNGINTAPITDVGLIGTGFHSTSDVKLINDTTGDEIIGANVTPESPAYLTVDFDITGARTGAWDVYVDNPTGSATLEDGFTINTLPPTVTSINPDTADNSNASFAMTIYGAYFTHNMVVKLKKGLTTINPFNYQIVTDTQAVASFNFTNKSVGSYDVIVETNFGTDTLAGGFDLTCGPPTADFSGTPITGIAPLAVDFFDASVEYNSCEITSWEWDFGDGGTSTDQNPTHTYTEVGKYHVKLTVDSDGGGDTNEKYFYIRVNETDDDDDDDTTDDDDSTDDDDNSDDDDNADDDDSSADDDDSLPGADDDDGQIRDEEDDGEASGGGCSW